MQINFARLPRTEALRANTPAPPSQASPAAVAGRTRVTSRQSTSPARGARPQIALTSAVEPHPSHAGPGRPASGDQHEATAGEPLHVICDQIQATVRMEAKQPIVQSLTMTGRASLQQASPAGGAARSGFRMDAERIQARRETTEAYQVTATGSPVRLVSQRMDLTTPHIQLSQAKNLVWTDRPGRMLIELAQDLQGQPIDHPEMVQIDWRQRMEFDGQQAKFLGDVLVESTNQRMRAPEMTVRLSRRMQLNNGSSAEPPKIASVDALGGVVMEARQLADGRMTSYSHLQVPTVHVDQDTGALETSGPGRVTIWKHGFQSNPGFGGPTGPPSVSAVDQQRLTYVRVDFQQRIVGNLRRGIVRFQKRVQVVYGPVDGWSEQVDPQRELGENDILLSCDDLSLAQGPLLADGRRTFSAVALGNTYVEGRTFTARGDRVSYDQAKDQLVLEGTARRDAVLSHQARVGGRRSETAARKILFWPTTGRVEVDDARYLDLSNLTRGRP